MRVGLVCPYSYTYPGGVGRHVEGLARELIRQGHEVRLLAPYDPDDRHARITHRGAGPECRPVPDHFVSLGRTVGIPANGAVSNLAITPSVAARVRHELRRGEFDVVHVHEPNVPLVSWLAADHATAPLVGTFHTYSTNPVANGLAANILGARRVYNRLHVRIAVSEAARWTCERFYGGRHRVIPNGVDVPETLPVRHPSEELRILFVGRAEERKGLPVALRAFEALQSAGVPARLTVAGVTRDEVEPLLLDTAGVEIAGRVSDEEKWRLLAGADVLCAPSLGGESFGIVLAEAFAAGTPVVASDIAGYRDVVRDGVDGLLVPAGSPAEVGEALHSLAGDPGRRERMGAAARERAQRFAWPAVTGQIVGAYEDAIDIAGTAPARTRGLRPADGAPPAPPRRSPAPEPAGAPSGRSRAGRAIRRGATIVGLGAGVALAAMALQRIGIESIGAALIAATPVWVLVALALMCSSMLLRAEAWNAILRAALPGGRVRRRDTASGTMIGVLMSATLPARLGEPSRALIVARRTGRVREQLPIVLGTLVSQTLLNILALCVLGSVMFATVGLFQGNEDRLLVFTLAPLVLLAAVLLAPVVLRGGRPSRFARAQQALAAARGAMVGVRRGLAVFRRPRLGSWAAVMQLSAWALQWLSCYALLVALGLDQRAGIGGAAAVLFAVNITAVLPVTPSNIGVFQAACVAVLSAYGVGYTDAFAYGVILQAVEVATALAMGMPALVREGLTWKDMRLRALHATPVELSVGRREAGAEAEA
ncbi:MAG TPA: lysylphosphatidylglycerol synthase domain-containing protein [Thermoleophilaceae bacterium]|nr:lysylphosphatidylglycerol synthase domain-containing protein [Thermoleophilaceae bacterium]